MKVNINFYKWFTFSEWIVISYCVVMGITKKVTIIKTGNLNNAFLVG